MYAMIVTSNFSYECRSARELSQVYKQAMILIRQEKIAFHV